MQAGEGRMSAHAQKGPIAPDKALNWSYTPGLMPQHHGERIHSTKHKGVFLMSLVFPLQCWQGPRKTFATLCIFSQISGAKQWMLVHYESPSPSPPHTWRWNVMTNLQADNKTETSSQGKAQLCYSTGSFTGGGFIPLSSLPLTNAVYKQQCLFFKRWGCIIIFVRV